ncbi:hypothetical protein SDC9_84518 [bioreactor metagenome]|uniref:Uncharacterized protein n=1 Tax=bioreactor metagenome TaxID=1076179 RepID=A0A644ZC88_9ZZZZ
MQGDPIQDQIFQDHLTVGGTLGVSVQIREGIRGLLINR